MDLEALDDSVPLLHLQIHHSPFHLPHLNFLLRPHCLLPPPPPLLRLQLLQTGLIFCVLSLRSLHSPVDQWVEDQEEGLREAESEKRERGREFFHNLNRVSVSKTSANCLPGGSNPGGGCVCLISSSSGLRRRATKHEMLLLFEHLLKHTLFSYPVASGIGISPGIKYSISKQRILHN